MAKSDAFRTLEFAMRNPPNDNGDRRPVLPSIWDLFGDELSETSGRYNFQTPSSIYPLPSGQERRYGASNPSYQDRPGQNSSFVQHHHQVPDSPEPSFYQTPILRPYPSPQERRGVPSLHHNLGTLPYRTPTPSADFLPLPSTNSSGRFPQTAHFPTSSDGQAADDERSTGGSYSTFRLFQPSLGSQPHDESARYECQYCGKAFNRPSTLRIHLNSHTGEKPFVCPVEGCGRSFSVLSNMRRHARIHGQSTTPEGTAQFPGEGTPSRDRRQTSLASSSSMASRKNYHTSSEDNSDGEIFLDYRRE